MKQQPRKEPIAVTARDIVKRAFMEGFEAAERAAQCQTSFDTTPEEAWEASQAKQDAEHVDFDEIVYYEPREA